MRKIVARIVFYWVILSSLLLLPVTTSLAVGIYNADTGYLVIPEVDVNGDTFYDNVTLKLNFTTGTFEVVNADLKPDTISTIPYYRYF